MTEITLIRHGETEWNKAGRIQGYLDSNLTDAGVSQAKLTAEALAGERFDAVYASPLGRAKRTAEIINEQHGHPIEFADGLKERNLGVMQGLTLEEFRVAHPESHESILDDPEYAVPEGESSRQRYNRGNSCMQEIADDNPNRHILVVSHGGILDGVFRKILDIPLSAPRAYSLFNCAINRIEIEDRSWRLLTWGDIRHLRGIGALDDE